MKFFLILLPLICCFNAYSQNEYLSTENEFPILGRGFNTKQGRRLTQSAFQNSDSIDTKRGNGANVILTASMTESNITLIKEQQYDASLQARYLAYRGGVAFRQETFSSAKDFSVSWFISCKKYYKAIELKANNLPLSDQAAQLLSQNFLGFVNQFGDEYISRLTIGNKAVITYTYTTSNREDRDAFSAKLNAAINTISGGANVDANFRQFLERSQQQNRLTIEAKVFGTNVNLGNLVSTDLNEVKRRFNEIIQSLTEANAVVLDYTTSPYPQFNDYRVNIDKALSEEFMERYLQVNGEIKVARDVSLNYPNNQSVRNNLREDINKRTDYITRLKRIAETYFARSSDSSNIRQQAEDELRNYLRKELDTLRVPVPRKILEISFGRYEDIQPNSSSAIRRLVGLPLDDNISVRIRGNAILPITETTPGNTWITFGIYVNGTKIKSVDKSNAAHHGIDEIITFPRPSDGVAKLILAGKEEQE